MVDLRQTKEWAEWLAATGWIIEKIKTQDGKFFYGFIKPMSFLGFSFMKLQRFEKPIDWKQLADVKKKHHVFWSVMEPKNEAVIPGILKAGYRLTRDPYLPMKTRVLDLTKSEKVLISEMSENFRRIIKKSIKSKLPPKADRQELKTISAGEFYGGWKRWTKSFILTRGQFDSLVKAFNKKPACRQAGVEFWALEKDGEILSAIMLLFTPDTCFYYQTWTSDTGRKSSGHVILTWETMRRAKKLKMKFYNFEGILDGRFPLKKWEGFTEFKRRFGGYELEYPGSYLKWF